MRSWSEERRSGTLEIAADRCRSPRSLVLGKFLACWALVALALVLTLPLADHRGAASARFDWGPVIGGYVATMLLAATYIAIGLSSAPAPTMPSSR